MTIFKKKATDIQETKKLPMTGKVKKGFRAYCTMVIVGALATAGSFPAKRCRF